MAKADVSPDCGGARTPLVTNGGDQMHAWHTPPLAVGCTVTQDAVTHPRGRACLGCLCIAVHNSLHVELH